MMDHMAAVLGCNPEEFRKINLIPPEGATMGGSHFDVLFMHGCASLNFSSHVPQPDALLVHVRLTISPCASQRCVSHASTSVHLTFSPGGLPVAAVSYTMPRIWDELTMSSDIEARKVSCNTSHSIIAYPLSNSTIFASTAIITTTLLHSTVI